MAIILITGGQGFTTLRMDVMERSRGEAINIATGKETTVKELAEMINEVTGNPASIKYMPKRLWDKSIRRRASIEKARTLQGYEPKVTVPEILKDIHSEILENKERIEETMKEGAHLW